MEGGIKKVDLKNVNNAISRHCEFRTGLRPTLRDETSFWFASRSDRFSAINRPRLFSFFVHNLLSNINVVPFVSCQRSEAIRGPRYETVQAAGAAHAMAPELLRRKDSSQ